MEARANILNKLELMNIDDIKNIWKEDMNTLEDRVRVNEEKIKKLEFNKASSTFDKFLKISLAGKNMALVYALGSIFLMYKAWGTYFYVFIVGLGAAAMIFSYFQHGPLKKLDLGSLSIIALQKEIYKFRMHTAKTAIYDLTIVSIWMVTAGLGFYRWTRGADAVLDLVSSIGIVGGSLLLFVFTFFGSKLIYKNIDEKLKESEDGLKILTNYQNDL
ncbi:hypothetical protein [Winogradskyella sp. UBA3174]|uniref:hypothetical protein n=1 Tax=Winogradskyella sp. UBA3174 TaxID=1947785 RepID=UPI0025CEC6D6|nr:hypothetical protein [Winogradskyella sp. UBA3174]|tara:strand:- start:8300 stop:8950 length:651 start_codon:yes stop_codon:yes gene_type:complete